MGVLGAHLRADDVPFDCCKFSQSTALVDDTLHEYFLVLNRQDKFSPQPLINVLLRFTNWLALASLESNYKGLTDCGIIVTTDLNFSCWTPKVFHIAINVKIVLLIQCVESVLIIWLLTLSRKESFLAWLSGYLLEIGTDKCACIFVFLAPDSMVELHLAISAARCAIRRGIVTYHSECYHEALSATESETVVEMVSHHGLHNCDVLVIEQNLKFHLGVVHNNCRHK